MKSTLIIVLSGHEVLYKLAIKRLHEDRMRLEWRVCVCVCVSSPVGFGEQDR